MQRHDPLPAEACEEGRTVEFSILCEGLKVPRDKTGKGKERQRYGERKEAMRFTRLQREGKRRDDVRNLNGKQKFAQAAIGEANGRERMGKDDKQGKKKKEERGKRKLRFIVKKKSDERERGEERDGNIQHSITQALALGARFVFEERLHVEAKNLREQIHCRLREENDRQAHPKRVYDKRVAEIVGNARTKDIRQRGKEQVQWTRKAKKHEQIVTGNWEWKDERWMRGTDIS